MPVMIYGASDTNKACVLWQARKPVVTAIGSASGYPVINLTDPATWSSWKPNAVGGWVQYDFGATVGIDAIGISAHTMTPGVGQLLLQHSLNGSTWTTIQTITAPSRDDIIVLFQYVNARYIRVTCVNETPNIGVLVVGSRLVFPHTPIDSYTPLHHSRKYSKQFNDSVKGAMLGSRVMASGADTTVDMGFVERQFADITMKPFSDHYNQGGTFFFAGWPAGQPHDMGYCRASDEEEIVSIEYVEAGKLANVSFGVRSYVG